jgi:hypothetical protein
MKHFAAFLLLLFTPLLLAEEVTLKQSVILKSGRNLVSLKPGYVVELISRDQNELTIKYKGMTGKIPASKLEESSEPDPVVKSDAPAPKAPPPAAKSASKAKKAENKPAESKPADQPRTGYGKAVQKARENAAAHDKNLVRPANEAAKGR